jgi:arginine decarboxylase
MFHLFENFKLSQWQLHTTTSPLYAILASNDIAATMMDHGSGRALTDECIREVRSSNYVIIT